MGMFMVTVGEAFDNLGFALKDNECVCIATVRGDRMIEQSLQDVRDEEVGTNRYFSTGTFPVRTTWGKGKRTGERVMRILELPFDFDLKDFLGMPKIDLIDLTDIELDGYLDTLTVAVEELFSRIRLPIHRLDRTGYGISTHIIIPDHEQSAVPQLRALHAGIVRRINCEFGGTLADENVKDAGSRIMRLVPCKNVYVDRKTGVIGAPRASRTVYTRSATITHAMLEAAAESVVKRSISAMPISSDKTISRHDLQVIVDTYSAHHQPGVKHFMGLAIAGQLGKSGMAEEQALSIVEAISAGDNKPWDRAKAVHDTYDKLRRGVDVTGYYVLRQFIPEGDIQIVDKILDKVRKATSATFVFAGKPVSNGEDRDDKNRPVKFEEYPEPPPDAFYGWFAEYVDIMHPTTEATRGFHLASALTVAGSISGRRVAVRYASEHIYPNQYTLLVGPTGSSRKGTSMKRAHRLPSYRSAEGKISVNNSPFAMRRDLGSGASVVKTLRENANTLLVFEEATTLFSNMHRQGGEALLDRLIEAWDTPDFIQDNVKNNPDVAYSPFLGIIAGIQPGRLEDALGANEIESGLANRLGIFFGVRREVIARAPEVDEGKASNLYNRFHHSVTSYPEGAALTMNAEAGEMWDRWYVEYSSAEGTEDEQAMRIRHPDMVQKWALLFAISDRSQEITLAHLKAAIAVLDWMWDGIKRRLPTWGVSADNKIEELIRVVLMRDGAMKRRVLQQRTSRRKWSGKDFASVFRSMVENGHLVTDAQNNVMLAIEYEKLQEQEDEDQQGGHRHDRTAA